MHHVALGAPGLAIENSTSGRRIACHLRNRSFALQHPKVSYNRAHLLGSQIAERRHANFGKPLLHNRFEINIRQCNDVADRCNVGSALASTAVRAMAGGAIAGKDMLAGGSIFLLGAERDRRNTYSYNKQSRDQGFHFTTNRLYFWTSKGGGGKEEAESALPPPCDWLDSCNLKMVLDGKLHNARIICSSHNSKCSRAIGKVSVG